MASSPGRTLFIKFTIILHIVIFSGLFLPANNYIPALYELPNSLLRILTDQAFLLALIITISLVYGTLMFAYLINLIIAQFLPGTKILKKLLLVNSGNEAFNFSMVLFAIVLYPLFRGNDFIFYFFISFLGITFFTFEFLALYKKLPDSYYEFLVSLEKTPGDAEKYLYRSLLNNSFIMIIRKGHYIFWLIILLNEFLSGYEFGISAIIRSVILNWNSKDLFGIVLILYTIIILIDLLVLRALSTIEPEREAH